jgi:hypothetical protein
MAVIGLTGSGKSVLQAHLLELRKFWVVLKTKADKTEYPPHLLAKTASGLLDARQKRIVLRPRPPLSNQQREIGRAFELMWQQGGWTVVIDELWYVDKKLKLGDYVDQFLTQGRDPGRLSVWSGMQRPSQITRFAIGESTHVISFGLEGRDAKILADATSKRFADVVTELPRHTFAWYNVPTRQIWVGRLDLRTGALTGGTPQGARSLSHHD